MNISLYDELVEETTNSYNKRLEMLNLYKDNLFQMENLSSVLVSKGITVSPSFSSASTFYMVIEDVLSSDFDQLCKTINREFTALSFSVSFDENVDKLANQDKNMHCFIGYVRAPVDGIYAGLPSIGLITRIKPAID